MTGTEALEALARGEFAFVDAGSGAGDSTRYCQERFGLGRGLGVEQDADLVREARDAGLDALCGDALEVALPEKCVSFVSMRDFLEHLPDERAVRRALTVYAGVARDFLFIQHPSFEATDYLAGLGLKIAWSEWYDHPTMMTLTDYRRLFASLGWRDVVVNPIDPIFDSYGHMIVPLTARIDALEYDPAEHDAKPYVDFDRPVYSRYDIFVRLNPDLGEETWQRVTRPEEPARVGGDSVALYYPATALWHMRSSLLDDAGRTMFVFGPPGSGAAPLLGDWDGDGVATPGVYDPRTAEFWLGDSRSSRSAARTFGFGPPGAVPLAGDWDGDGVSTVGVYVPESSHFWLKNSLTSGNADVDFSFGPPHASMTPVVGDWEGNGFDTVGLYDPRDGRFYLASGHESGPQATVVTFGPAGALPIAGDWDGDGRDGVGVYLPERRLWRLRNTATPGPDDVRLFFGPPGGIPLAGRW